MTVTPRDPMRILVLWADDSSPNLGVAALARGSHDLLRRAFPDAEFTFANYGARPPEIPWGRRHAFLLERMFPRHGMQDFLGRFSLIWDTRSGDSFADIYGLRRHVTMGLVHEFACQAGAQVIMAPQTIGPFNTLRGRALARRNLQRSHSVLARDPRSADAATDLGRRPDLITADLVFAIDQPVPTQRRDVLINVNGLLWDDNPHVPAREYRHAIREIVQRIRSDGRDVALLAHVLDTPYKDKDVPAVNALAQEIAGDMEVIIPSDLESARMAIAGSNLVIGSRMHACLNALSVGVPTIPLAYSRKFGPLLESMGWSEGFDLRTDDFATLPQRVASLAGKVDARRARTVAETGRATLEAVVGLLRNSF